MHDSVRYPGEEIKNSVFVARQNITQVGTVQDILEGGQDTDPDGGSVVGGNISRADNVSLREQTGIHEKEL